MNNTQSRIEDICELLAGSVPEVFATMVEIEATRVPSDKSLTPDQSAVIASVGFTGDVDGMVYLEVTAAFAQVLAAKMLGMEVEELDGDGMINDAIGELSNMMVGGVKSRLCDDGMPCVLTIPSIVRGSGLRVGAAGRNDRRLIGFTAGAESFVVEVFLRTDH